MTAIAELSVAGEPADRSAETWEEPLAARRECWLRCRRDGQARSVWLMRGAPDRFLIRFGHGWWAGRADGAFEVYRHSGWSS